MNSIHYSEIFNFYLHVPIAIFDYPNKEQFVQDCYETEIIPEVIPIHFIADKNHPLFKKYALDFKQRGIKQELKMLVIAVGYNNPYLS